jgi:hypothetical protein
MQETTNFWDRSVSTFPDDESPEFLQPVVAPSPLIKLSRCSVFDISSPRLSLKTEPDEGGFDLDSGEVKAAI